uniref:Cortistatin n=1 Tax=Tursiops truncatus TaxID=9739 RepID=A0A2U4AZK3_TURTR
CRHLEKAAFSERNVNHEGFRLYSTFQPKICTLAVSFSAYTGSGRNKEKQLLTFLAWWYEWASQARAVSFLGGEAREVFKRQEVLPLQQSTCRDETPCKNFYWKTFSSCK